MDNEVMRYFNSMARRRHLTWRDMNASATSPNAADQITGDCPADGQQSADVSATAAAWKQKRTERAPRADGHREQPSAPSSTATQTRTRRMAPGIERQAGMSVFDPHPPV